MGVLNRGREWSKAESMVGKGVKGLDYRKKSPLVKLFKDFSHYREEAYPMIEIYKVNRFG